MVYIIAIAILYVVLKLEILIGFTFCFPWLIAYFYRKMNYIPWSFRLQKDEKRWKEEYEKKEKK